MGHINRLEKRSQEFYDLVVNTCDPSREFQFFITPTVSRILTSCRMKDFCGAANARFNYSPLPPTESPDSKRQTSGRGIVWLCRARLRIPSRQRFPRVQ